MGNIESKDTISAREATLFLEINGQNIPALFAKSFDAKVEKEKAQVKLLGKRMTGHKTIGGEGTGTLKIYDVFDEFTKLGKAYFNGGEDLYFNAKITNEDPQSSFGRRTILVKGINLNDVNLAQFDVDGEVLEREIDFTFEDWELISAFNG